MKKILASIALVLAMAIPSTAEVKLHKAGECGERGLVILGLATKYGEHVMEETSKKHPVNGDTYKFMLTGNPDTKSWTAISDRVTHSNICLIASGDNYRSDFNESGFEDFFHFVDVFTGTGDQI